MPQWEYIYDNKSQLLAYKDNYPKNERVVILLHGLGVDSSSWFFQEAALGKAGFRPITPDLPGYGNSSLIGGKWSFQNIVEVMLGFTRFISSQPVNLIGISLGGAICIALSAKAPGLYQKTVLINSFSKLMPEKFKHFIYMITRFYKVSMLPMREQAEFMAVRLFPAEKDAAFRDMVIEQIVATDRKVYLQTFWELGRLNLDNAARKIVQPCLMITSEEDTTIPPTLQGALAHKIKNCQQIFVAGTGHAVVVQEPLKVNNVIIEFFKR